MSDEPVAYDIERFITKQWRARMKAGEPERAPHELWQASCDRHEERQQAELAFEWFTPNEDLRPHFDFSEEHIDSLKEEWLEALHELHDEMCPDEPLDEANRWFREKKEQAIKEEWDV